MPAEDTHGSQSTLFAALAAQLEREHGAVRIIETHISCVLIAGEFAYKLKKAVRLPFLDFSTLERRRFYCEEELRLNRRLAPEIYLDVLPITGSPEAPRIGNSGEPVLEYALKMRAFGQESLWSHRLEQGVLSPSEVDALALRLAEFHRVAPQAPSDSGWATAGMLEQGLREDLAELDALAVTEDERVLAKEAGAALVALGRSLATIFGERKAKGRVRECHGDLHSANVITVDGRVTAFDCIEFSEGMRWIDVMNDLAFICMDLEVHGCGALAARLLNGYLEVSGDYEGAAVFRYYEARRALVRTKVAWLRAGQLQPQSEEAGAQRSLGLRYLACAQRIPGMSEPAITIMRGCSGSGKSLFAGCVAEAAEAIRIRSDVERKRLHGLRATERPDAQAAAALYGPAATEATYARLLALAEQLARAGWPVVVDAVFLDRSRRRAFMKLAASLGIPFLILDVHASEQTMKSRITARQQSDADASDAGVSILLSQMAHAQPLDEEEAAHGIDIDMEAPLDSARAGALCGVVLTSLRRQAH